VRLRILHSFCSEINCRDGETPEAGLVADASGTLYGTASFGGMHAGVVFALIPNTERRHWAYRVLHDFCAKPNCKDGAVVFGPLIVDAAGNLYGVTTIGGRGTAGVAFELTPDSSRAQWTYRILRDVCGPPRSCRDLQIYNFGLNYAGASLGLPYDGTSPLYGTTELGGDFRGSVYSLTPALGDRRWSFKQLYAFCEGGGSCGDGEVPGGNVIVDGGGSLYGTTQAGGMHGGGALFSLTRAKRQWVESVAYSFCAAPDCADGTPGGTLLLDSAGNLVGTGGAGDSTCAVPQACGVVFRLSPGPPWQETVLHRFCQESDCSDGRFPIGSLVMDANANLFGITFNGGGHDIDDNGQGGGTIFKLGRSFSVLYRFCAAALCADGEYPWADIVMDASGRIFGTTQRGGAHNAGEVFELVP
jgi:uncharacterized repeat protein (TIGR03803 family)